MKTHDKKKDFIQTLVSMTDTEINDYIKAHGKRKPVEMCRVLSEEELREWRESQPA